MTKTDQYIPNRGDIIWIDFEPQAGKEITKRRPGLVLSSKTYNKLGYVIVCPVTTKIKNRPFEVKIDKKQAVLSDQIKSFDWKKRNARFKEKSHHHVTQKVIENIAVLLTG